MHARVQPCTRSDGRYQAAPLLIVESKRTGKPWSRVTTGKPRRGLGYILTLFVPVLVPVVGFTVLGAMGGSDVLRQLWQLLWEAPFPVPLLLIWQLSGSDRRDCSLIAQ
jgi:hypothetical protein